MHLSPPRREPIALERSAGELAGIRQAQGWKTDFSSTTIDLTEIGFVYRAFHPDGRIVQAAPTQ